MGVWQRDFEINMVSIGWCTLALSGSPPVHACMYVFACMYAYVRTYITVARVNLGLEDICETDSEIY